MMADIDEFYSKIQTMLMKMNRECGQLKFLSSKTTAEDSENILKICDRVENIFQDCRIPIGIGTSTTDAKCVEAFKYLILNTNFKCQEQLVEDIVNGHLVDMCPPISPYLLIEIVYRLKYEHIMAESILYFPIDLDIELMEIINRYITMTNYDRATNFAINLIQNSYKKLIILRQARTQSLNLTTSLDSMSMHTEELISALSDKKFSRSEQNLKETKKCERFGLTLRNIIGIIKNCFQCKQNGVIIDSDVEKLYKVTFGRNFIVNCEIDTLKSHLDTLNAALLQLLMKNLKEIDINTFIAWASTDVEDYSSTISLQQAIGYDCYYMLEFLKEYKLIELYDDLVECLQQLSSKPKQPSNANIEELYKSIDEGNQESWRELMNRYESWDNSTFEYIRKHHAMFNKDDFAILLEYLTLTVMQPGEEEHKQNVYNTATKVLAKLSIPDIYEVVIQYILKHNAGDHLESMHTEEMFINFIHRNSNLKSSANLRIALFFILKNPHKFLKILIRMSIGCSEWNNTMIPPKDLFLLSPVMLIREKNGDKLVLNVLRSIGLNTSDWDCKKFTNFFMTMIDENIFTADEFLNSFLIPMIASHNIPVSSVKFTLNSIRRIMNKCTDKINLVALLVNLAKTMSAMRRSTRIPKYTSDEIIIVAIRIFKSFLNCHEDWLSRAESRKIIDKIVGILQPIDQIHFMRFWYLKKSPDITDIMDDYARRIDQVILRMNDTDPPPITSGSHREDIHRHLILNATEQEFIRIASEMSVIHWRYFETNPASKDENDALHNFVKMTIQIGCFCLEFPDRTAPNTFGCLVISLVKFIKETMQLENKWDHHKLFECLKENIKSIDNSIKVTEYVNFYTELISSLDNISDDNSLHSLMKTLDYLNHFGSKCVATIQTKSVDTKNINMLKYRIVQDFINDCLMFQSETQSSIMRRVNELFFNADNDAN